ncbi:hypothetical protein TNCV_2726291 [Trichonephila clavipes]|nr:hypothetical protein TNCV_2726291 [Trichonephila clavipes]
MVSFDEQGMPGVGYPILTIHTDKKPNDLSSKYDDCRSSKRPPVFVVWKLGERVPAQVLSSSLDHGAKLRDPSPKALE